MDPAKGISIITPFYNQTNIFWETYNTVIKQTYTNWEWIIINDGSLMPAAIEVLNEVQRLNNQKIRVVSLSNNMGLPAARNKGVQEAFFDLVFFLDSDDLIEPDYLEKAWLTLQLNPEFSFVNSWSTGFGAKNYLWQAGLDLRERFLQQNWVAFAGLFRKKLFTRLTFNETRRQGLEDWEFWLQAATAGYWGYTIPEYLFHYRTSSQPDKWANWDNGRKQKEIKKQFQTQYSSLKKLFPNPQKSVYDAVAEHNALPGITAPVLTKKTVLIVLPWLELGGVERFTLHYMAAMAHVYDFILVTTNAGKHSHEVEFKKYSRQIYHLAALADSTAYPMLWSYVINTWQINLLVVSHALPAYYILPWLKASHPSLVVIDILHLVEENWKDGGYPKIAVDYTSYINKHVVANNQIHQFMANRGVLTEKLQTIYINVDTKHIHPVDEAVKTEKKKSFFNVQSVGETVLLFSGRFTAQKNVLLLPDIAAHLAQKGIQFIIAIAGDGPEKELLEEKIYQKRLQRYFRFMGSLSYAANIEAIQLADILILPSAWEGIATVLFEAMASATPVVATSVGGQQELIEEGTGILIPATNDTNQLIEAFTNTLEVLINDPALRKHMGEAARKRVEKHFDISLTHNNLHILFEQLLTRPSSTSSPVLPSVSMQDYYQNVGNWKQEQLSPSGNNWKQKRIAKIIKRFYKVITRKRPLQYLWTR